MGASLTWSLTSLQGVRGIQIFFGDDEFSRSDGTPVGLLTRANVNLEGVPSVQLVRQTVTLYFADPNALWLVGERREVEFDPNDGAQTLEWHIVNELLRGPRLPGNSETMPADLRLLSVTTNAGVCFVDFTSAFRATSTTAEMLMVYSIVNSLTELDNVNRVQFLIYGGHVHDDRGFSLNLNNMERNEEIIR
jgi:germination protein M